MKVISDESLRKVSQAIGNHITPAIYPEIKAVRIGERNVFKLILREIVSHILRIEFHVSELQMKI